MSRSRAAHLSMPYSPVDHHSPRALLIEVQLPRQTEEQVAHSLSELERLATSIGIRAVKSSIQRRPNTTAPTLLGEGKLLELAALTGGTGVTAAGPPQAKGAAAKGAAANPALAPKGNTARHKPPPNPRGQVPPEALDSPPLKAARSTPEVDLVLVDLEISPGQQRQLERALGVEVIDRTEVILRLFEQRARTHEARLQVEMARLRYQVPRLRDDASAGDREGGGGRASRGNTNVKLAAQRIKERLAVLRRELEVVQASGASRRDQRQNALRVALVGYTNAGKSSLMRGLTGSEVLVEDRLFATLDTTVRTLTPLTTPRILVSDTVGFIKNLPHDLVASFRSTLDESRDAGLLLLVVDASDPDWSEQLKVTRDTLAEIGAGNVPTRLIFNKIDQVDDETRKDLEQAYPEALQVSAYAPEDLARLHLILVSHFDAGLVEAVLQVPHADGKLLGDIHSRARVLDERFTDEGILLTVRTLPGVLEGWRNLQHSPGAPMGA